MLKLLLFVALFGLAFSDLDLLSKIDGHFIVVFNSNVTAEKRSLHLNRFGINTTHNYAIGDSFFGYSAYLDQKTLRTIRFAEEIKYIAADGIATAHDDSCSVQNDAIWGLNRIAERDISLTGTYKYGSTAGEGAEVFILDTGILINHEEFEGRAVWGPNFADTVNSDCNGHGTHVAGTVGGKLYGVAKKTTVISVKVLGCTGSGSWSGVIAGVDYTADKKNRKGKFAIANMSLGGGKYQPLNDAVAAGVKAGVVFVVAAGNSNADACTSSPSSTPTAFSVGATVVRGVNGVQQDVRTSWSNYGTCVHILAPGELIKAAWYTSPTSYNTISGTSMAAPHVAGASALYLATNPDANPKDVQDFVVSISTVGRLNMACGPTGNCKDTPNKLLYSAC